MILKKNKTCPFSNKCKYHNMSSQHTFCQGTNPSRSTDFNCDYINDRGQFIKEGTTRSSNDITGKMKLIME